MNINDSENIPAVKIYKDDLRVAQSIVQRDEQTSREFIYKKCYPLFKSIYDNYYTDCENVYEFINEIYVLILTVSKETHRCQLENYRGESSLATWLKTACLFYCYNRYKRKERIPIVKIVAPDNSNSDDATDRLISGAHSVNIDSQSIERSDLEVILNMMSNDRYRNIIRLRYLEGKSNEETASALEMSMANYYNKHKLAKEQFISVLNKETHNAKYN